MNKEKTGFYVKAKIANPNYKIIGLIFGIEEMYGNDFSKLYKVFTFTFSFAVLAITIGYVKGEQNGK